jgi:glycosyltransferase involved in cell wall biosynthesis
MSVKLEKMKIDVCLVTKDPRVRSVKGLEHVPVNKLIIERSKPLALARAKAIRKVTTEFFAFIDDDVEISKEWFKTLTAYMKPDVGAVQGTLLIKGLGKVWDNALNKSKRRIYELHLGQRGFLHNTLIRTELVRDWNPPPDLSAFEDYHLTQHVLKKGYRWIVVPTDSYHRKTWKQVWGNAIWAMEGWKKLNPSPTLRLAKIIKYLVFIVRRLLSFPLNPGESIYSIYLSIARIYGLLRR